MRLFDPVGNVKVCGSKKMSSSAYLSKFNVCVCVYYV